MKSFKDPFAIPDFDLADLCSAFGRDQIKIQELLDQQFEEAALCLAAQLGASGSLTESLLRQVFPARQTVRHSQLMVRSLTTTDKTRALSVNILPLNLGFQALFSSHKSAQSRFFVEVQQVPVHPGAETN